jgi:spermidine synthase
MTMASDATGTQTGLRLLPLVIVLLLFAASGFAALVYEIVWYQMLQLVIGSTAISLGFLLATFMGGLCLGSYFLPRLAGESIHPLRLYALIELGIGVCGLLVLFGLPLIDGAYIAAMRGGFSGMLLRGMLCAIVLLAPTFLMGASLPAIARFVKVSPEGIKWWGWLYAGNTLGAVLGCLTASFILLRLFDVAIATYAAVAVNIVVALASFTLAKSMPSAVSEDAAPQSSAVMEEGPVWPVYLTIGISGATALGAEVVWARMLGMMFGSTVYCFSIILAVFLIGLAAGGGIGAQVLRFIRPRTALAWCQIFLAGGIAWAVAMINVVLPYQPELVSLNAWDVALGDLIRALAAMLPASLLWGASFPLAMAAAARKGEDPAKPVSAVYAANTLGAIIGALSVSLVLVLAIGTRDTQRLMLVLAALSGLILLVPDIARRRAFGVAAALLLSLGAAGVLAWKLPAQPGEVVAYGRMINRYTGLSKVIDLAEGRNSTVAITQFNDGAIQISVSGHIEASNEIYDMRLQRMVGHMPAMLHPNPQKILGIGFGAGVSAGSFTPYPTVKTIHIAEIEPKVPPTSTRHFGPFDNYVMNDKRTTIHFDDARHYLLTTNEKYDIIASDPLDVWAKGTAALYSVEYFELVKSHLNPGGYFSLYVPLYETDDVTLRSEFATFFKAFPNGTIWANTINGRGYDLVLMGQAEPLKINIDEMEKKLRRPEYEPVAQSMREIGFNSMMDMYASYAGQLSDLKDWLADAPINTDKNLRLMYLAGWGVNSELSDQHFKKLVSLRKRPDNIFTGSEELREAMFQYINQGIPQGE